MRRLIIVRGPSGSGKSTIAKAIKAEYGDPTFVVHYETDMFFIENGEYKFDAMLLHKAHAWCKDSVSKAMWDAIPLIIVSNTNTTPWEINSYIKLADEFHYEVSIIKTPGPWDVDILMLRNNHNVPRETIEKQIARYHPYPDEIEWNNKGVFLK